MTTFLKDLNILGITEKEQVVFYAVIQLEEASVQDLADMVHMKRPTLYLYLENLKEKGLIREKVSRNKKTFQSISIKDLNKIIDQKIQSLRKLKTQVPKVIKESQKTVRKKNNKGFTIYRGKAGAHILAEEVARFDGPVYYFGSLKETEKYFDNTWYEKFYNRLRRKKMNEDFMISTWNSDMTVKLFYEESDMFNKRRFLPSYILPAGCFVFFGNKLIIMYYHPEITAIVLEDKMMVAMFNIAYQTLWQTLDNKNIPPRPRSSYLTGIKRNSSF